MNAGFSPVPELKFFTLDPSVLILLGELEAIIFLCVSISLNSLALDP